MIDTVLLARTQFLARYPSRCQVCGDSISPGQRVDLWSAIRGPKPVSHSACTPGGGPRELRCARCLHPVLQPTGWDHNYRRRRATGPATCDHCPQEDDREA